MLQEPKQEVAVSWQPQAGPQTAFINLPLHIEEVMYGGARGGGKTDAAIGYLLIMAETYGRKFTGIFFRRELTQLEGVIQRTKEIYPKHGGTYFEAQKLWKFKSGALIYLRHLERDEDAEKYQGWSVQAIVFEEAGNFPMWEVIAKLKGILRSPDKVPCRMILTANPGGPGTNWLRERYIDPAPLGYQELPDAILTWDEAKQDFVDTGQKTYRIYIPAKVSDNKKLMENDPAYVGRLTQTGSEAQVRAWLHGDWYSIPGAYFPEFDIRRHVLRRCSLPDHWTRYRCMDWGSAKPFAVYWVAVASENWMAPDGKMIPKGALVYYREWYGIKLKSEAPGYVANTGCRMFAEEIGAGITEREARDPPMSFGVLDPGAFARDGGYSLAERIAAGATNAGGRCFWQRADNSRTPQHGRGGGWDTVRARLIGEPLVSGGESLPMIYWFDSCIHAIRTLPTLQSDKHKPDDLDSESEDHAADAIRYGCMARPYMRPTPEAQKKMTTIRDVTLNNMWSQLDNQVSESSLI